MLEKLPLDIDQSRLHQDIEKYAKVELFSKGACIFTPEEMCKIPKEP